VGPSAGGGQDAGDDPVWIADSLVVFIGIGYLVSIPWLHFLVIPVLILVWLLPRGIQLRTKARAHKSDCFLCSWCRYALVGLEDEGICPECGSRYRRDVCVKLYQNAYKGYQPDPQVLKERECKAWRRRLS